MISRSFLSQSFILYPTKAIPCLAQPWSKRVFLLSTDYCLLTTSLTQRILILHCPAYLGDAFEDAAEKRRQIALEDLFQVAIFQVVDAEAGSMR